MYATLQLFRDTQDASNMIIEIPVFLGQVPLATGLPPSYQDAEAIVYYPQRAGDPLVFAVDGKYWCSRYDIDHLQGYSRW